MRGKSELVKKDAANQTSSGLDRDYITQWSYGVDETWTLLVPNAKGGASVPLAANTEAMKKADPNFMQIYQQLGQYWGDQPGTSGPVLCWGFCANAFHSRAVYSERSYQMGLTCSHDIKHFAFMGT